MKKTYKIPDMECSMCVMHLEGIEDTLMGVKKIEANYHKQQMVVEFDEQRISEERILDAIKRIGYTAIPLN
jgi:copper chaperone CopZ